MNIIHLILLVYCCFLSLKASLCFHSGNLQTFIDIKSARVAVGNDKQGKLVIVVVDGRSWESGYETMTLLPLLLLSFKPYAI